jgi:methionine synthase II (cobalamin-independent)
LDTTPLPSQQEHGARRKIVASRTRIQTTVVGSYPVADWLTSLPSRTIERAETASGPRRIAYVHRDCGFLMRKRSIADGNMRALVAGRDRYEGRSSARAA